MSHVDGLLCFSLHSAARAMNAVYQPLLDPMGLTYPQYIALRALWEKDACTVGDLGGRLGQETNSLTPLLKRMEAAGWVVRKRSAEDERQVIVTLTDLGRDLEAQLSHVPDAVLRASGLAAGEAEDLTRQLIALRRALTGQG